jgi:hypothetical protein
MKENKYYKIFPITLGCNDWMLRQKQETSFTWWKKKQWFMSWGCCDNITTRGVKPLVAP